MFGSYEPFLEIFSSKKFSRVVVYCSVIKVPVVLSSDSFNSLSQPFCFVKNFFIFLLFLLSLTSQLSYNTTYVYHLSTIFYKFFQLFFQAFFRHYIWYFYMILSASLLWIYKNYRDLPVVFADNIERRKRDLNPRAGFPTYTLSRGASSASWVFLLTLNATTAFIHCSILFSSALIVRNLLY